jgi:hypothetical protein
MTDTIQTVHLADNINAAFDKINENFEGLTDGSIVVPPPSDISIGDLQDVTLTSLSNGEVLKWNGSSWTNLPDSGSSSNTNISTDSDLNQYITNLLDSSFFISVINEEYLEQFNITTDVTYTDSDVQANASAIFTLESRIDATDSGITVLSQAIIDTQASLENITLGGIDSDLLADAIASANSTVISRIDANSDGITSFAGVIDSVENNMLLRDSATNDLIEINTTAISSLTSRINVNSDGLSVVVGDVTDLSLSLNQLISDGITLTPEQVTEALGGALESLTLRLDADSDKLVIEAAKVVDLETGLTAQESDLGVQITAVSNAQSSLVSRTEFDSAEGRITTLAEDIVTLNNQVDVTNPDGTLSTAIADAESELRGEITTVDGRITSVQTSLTNTLNAKIDSDIALATQTLTALIDSAGNTTSTWGIDLVAGSEDNPKVAGIKFGNDGDTADFAITTDTFKILPTDGTGNGTAPFSVVGGVVEMSGAKVTGDLDVTSSDTTGSMNITGNLITISDGSGNPRVKLGKL